jgi:toxin FitB
LQNSSSALRACRPGKRRKALTAALDEQIVGLFGERIVAFDTRAAAAYPAVVMRARRRGHPIAAADAQIAAIAVSRQFSMATRDVALFQAAGVHAINPWTPNPYV